MRENMQRERLPDDDQYRQDVIALLVELVRLNDRHKAPRTGVAFQVTVDIAERWGLQNEA